MGKGAKQKSNVILMATGSKHARPAEPMAKSKLGPPPDEFSGVALKYWKWAAKQLTEFGTIMEADRVGLETLCLAVQRRNNAQQFIDDLGEIYEDPMKGWTKNPACTVIVAENNIIARLLSEFGLTPASRGKVSGPGNKPRNDFEEF